MEPPKRFSRNAASAEESTPRRFTRREGLALAELLLVLAILAALSVLLIPATQQVRKRATAAKCAANLKSVGALVFLYAGEHEGKLPGPLWTTQNACYNRTDTRMLGTSLAPYLGLTIKAEVQVLSILVCPGWEKTISGIAGKQWQEGQAQIADKVVFPFGTADVDIAKPAALPYRITNLLNRGSAVMFSEMDQQGNPAYAGASGVPKTPVHGSIRNVLFWDGHVAGQPVQ